MLGTRYTLGTCGFFRRRSLTKKPLELKRRVLSSDLLGFFFVSVPMCVCWCSWGRSKWFFFYVSLCVCVCMCVGTCVWRYLQTKLSFFLTLGCLGFKGSIRQSQKKIYVPICRHTCRRQLCACRSCAFFSEDQHRERAQPSSSCSHSSRLKRTFAVHAYCIVFSPRLSAVSAPKSLRNFPWGLAARVHRQTRVELRRHLGQL